MRSISKLARLRKACFTSASDFKPKVYQLKGDESRENEEKFETVTRMITSQLLNHAIPKKS